MSCNIILITNGSRPRLLEQTLRTLYENTPGGAFNLVVIYDGMTMDDFPSSMTDPYIRYGIELMAIMPACNIIGRLKNLGTYWSEKQFVRGEWLCFIDDDIYFHPNWLDKAAETMQIFNQIRILGGIRHPFHGPRVGGSYKQGPTHTYRDFVETDAVAGYFHFMRWSTWDSVGPYDAHAKGTGQSEDYKLCRDIVAKGGMVGYCEPAIIAHCGITGSNGKTILGAEQIERAEGVLYL